MNTRLFLPDDYDRINKKYFKKLREENNITGDPSFWYDPYSAALDYFENKTIQKYRSDYQKSLDHYKAPLMELFDSWDDTKYDLSELTLCASATSASMILLSMLKQFGVSELFFETPAYFASLSQAEMIGMKVTLLPTYKRESYRLDFSKLKNCEAKAFWLTQPRFGLGLNQDEAVIENILAVLRDKDFLIIDEATEQTFPSHLKKFIPKQFPQIIKIRSVFKGMGINGPRISYILHAEKFKSSIENCMENTQGAIDIFSLEFALKHCVDVKRFRAMLGSANQQVTQLNKLIQTLCVGTNVSPNPLVNGYIGSAAIDFSGSPHSYIKTRELFLKHCFKKKVPVITGATMKFAIDERWEHIRINHFNYETSIVNGIKALFDFTSLA